MQKLVILSIIVLSLIACSKTGKKSKDGVTVTSPINEDKTKIPSGPELPTEYDELKPTKNIHPEMFTCLLDPDSETQKTSVQDRKSSGVNSFNIYFKQNFIAKVVDDLKSKANGSKVSPDFFWTNIDPKLGNTLNNYLMGRYIHYNKENFDNLRKRIAYGITYFMEIEDYSRGLAMKFSDGKALKLAFSSNPKIMEHITICDNQELNDYIIIPNRYADTEDITGAISCTKGQESVKFTILKNERVKIELKNLKKRLSVYLPKADVDVEKKSTEIEFDSKGLDIEVEFYNYVKSVKKGRKTGRMRMRDQYTYYNTYYKSADIYIESGEFEYKHNGMNCKTIKPFRL